MLNKLKAFNEFLALRATLLVATMGCVYLFTAWALLPLVLPKTQGFVFYISGGILQLSLLPLIMVGQNLLNRNSEARAEQDHAAVIEILADIRKLLDVEREMQTEEATEIVDLTDILACVARIEAAVATKSAG